MDNNRISGWTFQALKLGSAIKQTGAATIQANRLKKKTTTISAGYSFTAFVCRHILDQTSAQLVIDSDWRRNEEKKGGKDTHLINIPDGNQDVFSSKKSASDDPIWWWSYGRKFIGGKGTDSDDGRALVENHH